MSKKPYIPAGVGLGQPYTGYIPAGVGLGEPPTPPPSRPEPSPITVTPEPIRHKPTKPPTSGAMPYAPSTNHVIVQPPIRPSPPASSYLGKSPYKPYREFPFEKLEEMRKKRLAKMPEAKPEAKPVMPAIPPTIKFGTYEVKTEYVAVGATLALIIIAVVLLT